MSVSNASSGAREPGKGGIFPAGHLLPFSLVTSLFFMWGIPNNLNDVLIRQFMKSFPSGASRRAWCNRRSTWAIFCWRSPLPC